MHTLASVTVYYQSCVYTVAVTLVAALFLFFIKYPTHTRPHTVETLGDWSSSLKLLPSFQTTVAMTTRQRSNQYQAQDKVRPIVTIAIWMGTL